MVETKYFCLLLDANGDTLQKLSAHYSTQQGFIGHSFNGTVVASVVDGGYKVVGSEAEEVRIKRNLKLSETDWTQVADAPVDQAAWAVYRQELRDITEQEGFPTSVVWPSTPD